MDFLGFVKYLWVWLRIENNIWNNAVLVKRHKYIDIRWKHNLRNFISVWKENLYFRRVRLAHTTHIVLHAIIDLRNHQTLRPVTFFLHPKLPFCKKNTSNYISVKPITVSTVCILRIFRRNAKQQLSSPLHCKTYGITRDTAINVGYKSINK